MAVLNPPVSLFCKAALQRDLECEVRDEVGGAGLIGETATAALALAGA